MNNIDIQLLGPLQNSMEYEKCYFFQPEIDEGRPTKRRRTEPQGLQASWPQRKELFKQAWESQQKAINTTLGTMNHMTIDEISTFLDHQANANQVERIPTGLILAGPNSALRTSVVMEDVLRSTSTVKRLFVPVTSGSSSNLKGILKIIIQKATSRSSDAEDDDLEEVTISRKGPKLLNYDLQILQDFVQERNIQQVVLAFDDTEAFDSELLSELIELFHCWQDRIPFACLLNIATSVHFLQQRLSTAAVKCLNGTLFDAALHADEIENVFNAAIAAKAPLWLGSNLVSLILERQSDYIQGVDALTTATKYAYMSHYYANALSIFLDNDIAFKAVPKDHLEAVRNLPSFRLYARRLLANRETKDLRTLLDHDETLFNFIITSVSRGREAISSAIIDGTQVIRHIQACLPSTQVSSQSSLYVQAMSGKLNGSSLVRTLLLVLRKSPSNNTLEVINKLSVHANDEDLKSQLSQVRKNLVELMDKQGASGQPLRSEDDVKNSTLRTTIVAQKVELSKQKSALSKQDTAYTTIVRQLSDVLESYLARILVDPKDLVLSEIFLYDLRSPYREVFTPRPRHAIERALAAPHDYLDCDCCGTGQGDEGEATLAGTQPLTAILYQLYLESGSLINANDLWQAFQAVVGGDDEEEDEQRTMALFQRGLSELRYLGLVKNTRRRVDHVAKVAWRGL